MVGYLSVKPELVIGQRVIIKADESDFSIAQYAPFKSRWSGCSLEQDADNDVNVAW